MTIRRRDDLAKTIRQILLNAQGNTVSRNLHRNVSISLTRHVSTYVVASATTISHDRNRTRERVNVLPRRRFVALAAKE